MPADEPQVQSTPILGGRVESFTLAGGLGVPLLVMGGVETALRPLAGTENVLVRRWSARAEHRPVTVLGRPLPDQAAETGRLSHPRVIADAVAVALRDLPTPMAIEAESGGGRISLWLTVDHPELVSRLVLASVASETPPESEMTGRMALWLELAERGAWGEFFARMAVQMKPAGSVTADAFDVAAGFQPQPATPERFIGELKATLDPSSFVTDRLGEISVPTLVLAGGQDQVVPPAASRLVADRIPGARFELDPDSGHTVRSSLSGYDQLVETFLAEGD